MFSTQTIPNQLHIMTPKLLELDLEDESFKVGFDRVIYNESVTHEYYYHED